MALFLLATAGSCFFSIHRMGSSGMAFPLSDTGYTGNLAEIGGRKLGCVTRAGATDFLPGLYFDRAGSLRKG